MGVFLSISNINFIINPDEVPKNRCGRWTGNKELINVGLKAVSKVLAIANKTGGHLQCMLF